MNRMGRDLMGVLAALVGLVLILVVLVQGAFWLLTRPGYVVLDVPPPGGADWGPASTDTVLFDSGTLAYDVRWQVASLPGEASWEATATAFSAALAGTGWREAPATYWDSHVYDDVCASVLRDHFSDQSPVGRVTYLPADSPTPGPDFRATQQPASACLVGWQEGDRLTVVLITSSAAHPNW
ncbi:MAG: hypothetical protein Kow0077_14070 [Anaerolineae bacterium]